MSGVNRWGAKRLPGFIGLRLCSMPPSGLVPLRAARKLALWRERDLPEFDNGLADQKRRALAVESASLLREAGQFPGHGLYLTDFDFSFAGLVYNICHEGDLYRTLVSPAATDLNPLTGARLQNTCVTKLALTRVKLWWAAANQA
jgi:hypothetical protein